MTSELRPADSPWECFRDEAYYHMWCLRSENWRTFGQGFHLMRGEEAEALRDLLNEQATELAKIKALAETLAGALGEAITWNSHDDEGVPAVWLDQADEALLQYKETSDETSN